MATTTNLALNEPAYNSTSPTWDQPLNYNASILDQVFGNTTYVVLPTGASATTAITGPSSSAAGSTTQAMRLYFQSALTANQTATIPSGISGQWIAYNGTTGAYTVTLKTSASGSTGVTLPQGYNLIVYSDGTNVYKADDALINPVSSLSITGTLSVDGNSTFTGTSTFNGASTFNATATLNGSSSTLATIFKNVAEPITISAAAASGTINFDVLTQSIVYYTSNSTGNFTINIRGNGSNSLNSIISTGQVITLVFINTNGATAYYNNAIQVDGVSVTPKWQGSTPSGGNANSLDIYTYTVMKTASSTYTVLASQTQFL